MILTKLKEATKTQHLQLETSINVLENTFDSAKYTNLLFKFYGFYAPIEPQILLKFEEQKIGFDYTPRLKVNLLENDLRVLRGGKDESNAPEVCFDLPSLKTFAQMLGCMYVLEGATLGGQIISRQLRQNLNLTPENGAAFFNSYGEKVGQMWKEFGVMATEQSEILDADEEIIVSAQDTFTKFEKWVIQKNQ